MSRSLRFTSVSPAAAMMALAIGLFAPLPLVGLAGPRPGSTEANDGTWTQPAFEGSPVAQEAQAGIYDALRSRMLIFGGWDGARSLNTTYALSLTGSPAWTRVDAAGTPPDGRYAHSVVYDSSRDRLLVFGGRSQFSFFNDVWQLSLSGTPTWTQLTPAGISPSQRFGHEAIYDPVRDRMIVFGGYDGAFRNDFWELTLTGTPTWTQLVPTGTLPSRRDFATSIYDPIGDRLVMFGGNSDVGGPYERSDTWALKLSGTPAWIQLAPAGTSPSARLLHKSFYDSARNRMVVMGGYDGTTMVNDAYALTLGSTPAWSNLSPGGPPPDRRSDHTIAYDPTGDRGIVFGGRDLGQFFGDTWQLSLAGSPSWTQLLPTLYRPPARLLHKSAYDASRGRMVMFAGWGGYWLSDLWALTIGATPLWQPLSTGSGPIPPARSDHVAVVDPSGDRFVVFGGRDLHNFFDDTWSYDMAAETWSELTPLGTPPSAREAMAGVYDPVRDRLIIFGGWDGSAALDQTWELTLGATPTWSQILPSGTLPAPRYAHSMIYDPLRDRLLVFGGFDQSSLFNDVWALNLTGPPVWSLLIPFGTAPSNRDAVEAIYDPVRDRMILYGGYDGTFLSDVLALDLAGGTPVWSQLSPTGTAPSRRDFSSTIYDPVKDRLVLFGGNSDVPSPPAMPVGDTWMLNWGDLPTPTRVAFAEEQVLPGTVKLTWFTPDGADQPATAYRMAATSDWEVVAQLVSDASGRFVLQDRVAAGGRYAYRLGTPAVEGESFTDPRWVQIPGSLEFRLSSVWPNPSYGMMKVSFALPVAGNASLDLLDVRGRRIVHKDLSAMEPGSHVVDLSREAGIGPGVYVLKLTQGARTAQKKVAVIR